MSKKSFRENNPALQFITPAQEAPARQPAQAENTDTAHTTQNTYYTHIKPAPKRQETKSKRLNLLIQPSLHEELGKIAYVERVSLNELILRAAREYAASHQDAVRKYDEFTGE